MNGIHEVRGSIPLSSTNAVRLIAILALVLVAAPPAAGGEEPEVVRVYYESAAEIGRLQDFDLLEFNDRARKFVLVIVDRDERAALEARGLRVETDPAATADIRRGSADPVPRGQGIPGFPCYRTVEETFEAALDLVAARPDLATWLDVGDSWERSNGLGGYDMMLLRLTNAAFPGPKPKLIVTAAIHAREYTPAELATRFAELLVSQHGVDADATWILDHHEVHLMLQTNPDGRKQAEAGQSWRKNTNRNYCGTTSVNRGADLNRNFPFRWGCCGGSSGSACGSTYRGPAAASEPETRSVRDYLVAELPDQRAAALEAPAPLDAEGVFIDLHSYGELLLWPWGFGGLAPNGPALQTLGRKLAYFNGHTPEQSIDLYVTDGTTIDFAYGELGVAAFTCELGTQFFQSCATFESTILPQNLETLRYAAKLVRTPYATAGGPDALGVAVTPQTGGALDARVLSASVDDTRYNTSNGAEPVEPIAAAEAYVDVPPWDVAGGPVAIPLGAADGAFDEPIESVTGLLDPGPLAAGRHIVFVRGRDAGGVWGPFSAAFLDVQTTAPGTLTGRIADAATDLPLAAEVAVEGAGAGGSADPGTGVYSLAVAPGTWSVRAEAAGHLPQTASGVGIASGVTTTLDFQLVADGDEDGVGDAADCLPGDPAVWAVPGPATRLELAAGRPTLLTWKVPDVPGGSGVVYDVLASAEVSDFLAATCVATGVMGPPVMAAGPDPGPGSCQAFLVRARNPCGGNLGTSSAGVPREGPACP